jgi:hypothetical protein
MSMNAQSCGSSSRCWRMFPGYLQLFITAREDTGEVRGNCTLAWLNPIAGRARVLPGFCVCVRSGDCCKNSARVVAAALRDSSLRPCSHPQEDPWGPPLSSWTGPALLHILLRVANLKETPSSSTISSTAHRMAIPPWLHLWSVVCGKQWRWGRNECRRVFTFGLRLRPSFLFWNRIQYYWHYDECSNDGVKSCLSCQLCSKRSWHQSGDPTFGLRVRLHWKVLYNPAGCGVQWAMHLLHVRVQISAHCPTVLTDISLGFLTVAGTLPPLYFTVHESQRYDSLCSPSYWQRPWVTSK